MTSELGRTIVLPPLGPLFSLNNYFAYESEEQRERYEEDMARYFGVPVPKPRTLPLPEDSPSLRTPTGTQPLQLPSSSPVKKDANCGVHTALSPLQLDSPEHNINHSHSPLGEEEKLRVSRERNRLHAQRTRIRKRELLESLKERIEALQDEYELLKQAYDFHATAVSLLTLGDGSDYPCVHKLEQVGIYAEDKDEQDETEDDESSEHEKGCVCHDKKASSEACTCVGSQLNANGKRPYAPTGNQLLGCSKEERERVRRERNRLHARRARLRKKLVLEKSQQAVHDLRERNDRLRSRLSSLVSSIYGADAVSEEQSAATS